MKYDKELYTDSGFSDGNMCEEIACYQEKLVKCRKQHTCSSCDREIMAGDPAVHESGFMDGQPMSIYTCTDCIEQWLEETGQVGGEDD